MQKLTLQKTLAAGTSAFGSKMRLTQYLLTEPLGQDYELLINCLSGAVDFVPNKILTALKKGNLNNIPRNTLKRLEQRGYLYKNENEEHNQLNKLNEKYNSTGAGAAFIICPTFKCNLACPYCFQKDLKNKNTYLSKDSTPYIFKAFSKLMPKEKKGNVVQLFGGEPLLPKNKSFVNEIFQYCACKNLPIAITTNGTTLLKYKDLIQRYKNQIKVMQITIDGPPNIHNKRRVPPNKKPTFNIILEGIKFVTSHKIGVQARVNVDNTNYKTLPLLVKHFQKANLLKNEYFNCTLAPVQDHCNKNKSNSLLNENELLNKLDELVIDHPQINFLMFNRIPKIVKHLQSVMEGTYSGPRFTYCEANRGGYYIFGADGLIYPCSESAGNPQLAIGRFLPELIIDEEKLHKWSQRTINTLGKCRTCSIAPLCGGGCTYAAHKINGDIDKPYCHDAHKIIKNYIKEKKYELWDLANKNIA